MDNLVVVYENLADAATLTASSTAGSTSKENLKLNTKSKVWRTTATSGTLLVALSPARVVTAVVLPYTNLTPTATIRIRGFTSNPTLSGTTVVGGTEAWDSGTILAAPWDAYLYTGAGTAPSGVSVYSYGGGTCARAYYDNSTAVTGVTIEIVDTSNTSGYIEASRLVMGEYWSPQFNTSYGLSVDPVDLSKHERTEAGDLITTPSPRISKLNFDMKYLSSTDRATLMKILKSNGLVKPLFISLFPYNIESNKERDFQLFGKLSSISSITHPVLSIYSSQITLEEI